MNKVMKVLAVAGMAATAVMNFSCEKAEIISNENEKAESGKLFHFTCKGDFTDAAFADATRAGYLKEGTEEMSNLWVYDYMNGTKVQELAQVPTDEDWGVPSMKLALGTHHVYFVASKSETPSLSGTTWSWSKVKDTFWQDYQVEVKSTSNGNRAVTLNRQVAKLSLTVTDAIPEGSAKCIFKFSKAGNSLNYLTGFGTQTNGTSEVVINSAAIGQTNAIISAYVIAPNKDMWSDDVTISIVDAEGKTISERTATGIQLQRNRVTTLSGAMNESSGFSLSYEDWGNDIEGQWDNSVTSDDEPEIIGQ